MKRGTSAVAATEGVSINTPMLEIDIGTHLPQSQYSARPDILTDEEDRRIQQLRDQHLRAQRPADFIPFSGSVFEGTADVKTMLERSGFEIIEDE